MSPLVDFQIFGPRKNFLAAVEGAGEGLFPRVDSDVVHQLVFGFERLLVPGAVLPVADIFGVFRSTDMLHRHMGNQFIHGPEGSGARQLPSSLMLVTPLADEFVLHGLLGAPEESVATSTLNCHVERFVQTQKLRDELLPVSLGVDSLAVRVTPG